MCYIENMGGGGNSSKRMSPEEYKQILLDTARFENVADVVKNIEGVEEYVRNMEIFLDGLNASIAANPNIAGYLTPIVDSLREAYDVIVAKLKIAKKIREDSSGAGNN